MWNHDVSESITASRLHEMLRAMNAALRTASSDREHKAVKLDWGSYNDVELQINCTFSAISELVGEMMLTCAGAFPQLEKLKLVFIQSESLQLICSWTAQLLVQVPYNYHWFCAVGQILTIEVLLYCVPCGRLWKSTDKLVLDVCSSEILN